MGRARPCQSSDALNRLLSIETLQALASAPKPAGCFELRQEYHFLQDAIWKVEQGWGAVTLVHVRSFDACRHAVTCQHCHRAVLQLFNTYPAKGLATSRLLSVCERERCALTKMKKSNLATS